MGESHPDRRFRGVNSCCRAGSHSAEGWCWSIYLSKRQNRHPAQELPVCRKCQQDCVSVAETCEETCLRWEKLTIAEGRRGWACLVPPPHSHTVSLLTPSSFPIKGLADAFQHLYTFSSGVDLDSYRNIWKRQLRSFHCSLKINLTMCKDDPTLNVHVSCYICCLLRIQINQNSILIFWSHNDTPPPILLFWPFLNCFHCAPIIKDNKQLIQQPPFNSSSSKNKQEGTARGNKERVTEMKWTWDYRENTEPPVKVWLGSHRLTKDFQHLGWLLARWCESQGSGGGARQPEVTETGR